MSWKHQPRNTKGRWWTFKFEAPTTTETEDTMGDTDDENDDDKKFEERFNKLFHKASGEREKRFEKKLTENLTKTLGENLSKQFMEQFEQFTAKLSEKEPEKKPEGEKPAGGGTVKLSPEHEALLKQAQKDAQEAKAQADQFRKEKAEAEAKALRGEERQALVAGLNGKVKHKLFDMTVNQLHASNIVRDPESGKMLWKNGEDDVVPFEKGLEAWLKSDVAKELAPPREVGGSGGKGPAGGGSTDPNNFGPAALGNIILGSIPR